MKYAEPSMMSRRLDRPLLSVLLTLLALAGLAGMPDAAARQALVTSQDVAALEIGQAFLTHHGERCLAVMPTHVSREAARPALLGEGPSTQLGEVAQSIDLGADIGLADVAGAITSDCGPSALTIRRAVDRLVQQGRLGTLRSINGDGTVAQLAVAIVDDDGQGLLRVQPTHSGNPIRKGLSGSQLMIDGAVVGMLLSVHARTGIGTVMRIDHLMSRIDNHLMGLVPPRAEAKRAQAVSDWNKVEVVAWNALPVAEDKRAANLTAEDDHPPWQTRPTQWPATIDLRVGEGIRVIRGLAFDGRGIADAGTLPAHVEVFMNLTGEPRNWRSVTSEQLVYKDGIARVAFAPTRARLVRLSFSASVGGGPVLSLDKVTLNGD
jgi:hypothetical protein